MANPRKFSEKIALHTQKQAEETAAFEQIIQEVTQATKPPSLNVSAPQYKGGSLPNVNQISGLSSNSIDLTSALHTLENMRQGKDVYRDRVRSPSMSPSVHSNLQRIRCRVDTSPYGSAYLSPPSDSSWRRTNSDSALHQSVGLGFNISENVAGLIQNQHRKMATLPERTQLPVVSGGMGLFPSRAPGLNIDQCGSENGGLQIPMSNNTGSLPDLTNLHFQSPLSQPLDNEDSLSPYSSSPQPGSPLSPSYCGRLSMMGHKQHNVSPTSPLSPLSPSSPIHSPGAHNHDSSLLHSPIMRRRYEHSSGSSLPMTTLSSSCLAPPVMAKSCLNHYARYLHNTKATVIENSSNNLDLYNNSFYSRPEGNHIGPLSPKSTNFVLKNHLQKKMETLSVSGRSNYYYQPSGNGLYKEGESDQMSKSSQHSPNEDSQQYSPTTQTSGSPVMYTTSSMKSPQDIDRVSLTHYYPGSVSPNNLQYSDYNQSTNPKGDPMKPGFFSIPSFSDSKALSSTHTINPNPQTPTSIPDIMVSDFSYATPEELQRQELVKDLGSAIASLSSSFESDLFPDEALKAGLDPIDLDGLQMLTDEMSCVTDPATEDNFRLDHLHK